MRLHEELMGAPPGADGSLLGALCRCCRCPRAGGGAPGPRWQPRHGPSLLWRLHCPEFKKNGRLRARRKEGRLSLQGNAEAGPRSPTGSQQQDKTSQHSPLWSEGRCLGISDFYEIVLSPVLLGFVAFSSMPELARRIRMNFALGPVVSFKYPTGIFTSFFLLPNSVIKVGSSFSPKPI